MTFGYGAVASFTTDRDYRITGIKVGARATPDTVIDRSYDWTGDAVDSIVDNKNPGTTPGDYGSQSQSFSYSPTRRLRTASGYYGTLAWLYDANGNRIRETANGVISATPTGGTARSFTYDASGNIATDTRTGALGMSFEYDVEGRLSKAFQTSAPARRLAPVMSGSRATTKLLHFECIFVTPRSHDST